MFSFKDYLDEVNLNVSFDPDKEDVGDVVNRAKMAHRVGQANPQKWIKQKQQDLQQKEKETQVAPADDPLKNQRLQIQDLEMRLAKMKQMLAANEEKLEKQRQAQQGATAGQVGQAGEPPSV